MNLLNLRLALLLCFLLTALSPTLSAEDGADFPTFKAQTLDANIGKVCYAVTLADVNGDGKQDIVAVTENRVLWFENPGASGTWKSHTMIENQTVKDNVCIAAHDIDGDGKVDFALGAGWTKTGTIQWISRGKTLADPWQVHAIGEEVWLHRMRFADVLGTGKPQLVISPLIKTVGNGIRLTAFSIPEHPKTDRWQPTVLDNTLNRMHNHWHHDVNHDGTIDTLTASQEGVFLITRTGKKWTKTKLGAGASGSKPTGAGEIKYGHLKDKTPFIVTVEPMHGNAVVVYTKPKESSKLWERHVLDDTLNRGHALWVADIDNDGDEEIVLGHSDKGTGTIQGPGVYIYDAQDNAGTKWKKHVIDNGGIATEDAVAADLNGDGWVDIVAGGRATHNLKLYLNQGK